MRAAFNPSVAAAIYAAAITAQVMAASAFGLASKSAAPASASASLPPAPFPLPLPLSSQQLPYPIGEQMQMQMPGYPASPSAMQMHYGSYLADVQQAGAALDPLTLQRIYYSAANAASAAAALQQPHLQPHQRADQLSWFPSLQHMPSAYPPAASCSTSAAANSIIKHPGDSISAPLGYAEEPVVSGPAPYMFYDHTRSSLENVAARQPSGSFSSMTGVPRALHSIPSLPEGEQQVLFTERRQPPASGELLFEAKPSPLSLHKIASTSAVQSLAAGARCGPIAPPQRSQSATRLSLDPAHANGLAKAVGEYHHFAEFAKQFEAFGREDPQEAEGVEGSSAGRFFLGGGPWTENSPYRTIQCSIRVV